MSFLGVPSLSPIVDWFKGLPLISKIAIAVIVILVVAVIVFILIPAVYPPYVGLVTFKGICPEKCSAFLGSSF